VTERLVARRLQLLKPMSSASVNSRDGSGRSPSAGGEAIPWEEEREQLLQTRIPELNLRIDGTPLQRLVDRLYDELDAAGIRFRPRVYLSDEWACPDGVPLIGIPFYLADPRLMRIEDEMMDGVEAESDEDILGLLRHECGHAFCYAHKLYETEEWLRVFGRWDLPYRDDYTPRPFSRAYVRHLPAWYAQKHPDEDFAETFAVWLSPESDWRTAYRDWGAYPKLLYVDRIVREYGPREPVITGADYDYEHELDHTVAAHYHRMRPELGELPAHFDADLMRIVRRNAGAGPREPSVDFAALLDAQRRRMGLDAAYWTGLYDVQVRSLISHLIERCRKLELRVPAGCEHAVLVDFAAFVTTLCMNKLYKGEFVLE
jgi:hypothetical protein